MNKQRVITIHGLNSDGPWHEMVEKYLAPHFECTAYRYRDYRHWGFTKILLWPLLGLASLVVFLVAILVPAGGLRFSLLVAALLLLVSAIVEPWFRRLRVLSELKIKCDQLRDRPIRPHLIAHSFGSFLTGSMMQRFASVSFQRVILTGSVLTRSFPWRDLRRANPMSFLHIRNEVGKNDPVPILATIAGLVVPNLGGSGYFGFHLDQELVHDCDEVTGECALCLKGSIASIHNVRLETNHSEFYKGESHVRDVWLPWLWGFSPSHYSTFLELCGRAVQYENERRWPDLADVQDELHAQVWKSEDSMAAERSLGTLIEDYVFHRVGRLLQEEMLEEIVSTAIRLLCLEIVRAIERRNGPRPFNEDEEGLIRGLDPRISAPPSAEVAAMIFLNEVK